MSKKALIFDVGDILYDASVWRKWLALELHSRGLDVTYTRLVEAWESLLVDVYKGNAEYWSRFRTLMQQFALPESELDEMEKTARQKGREVQVDRVPMPQVPETLSNLFRRGIRLCALSDTESGEAGIRKTLNQLGIESYFHAVVSSADIGHAKPEPAAFDYAIEKTGLPKFDCAFVAHDIDELQGAQAHDLYAIAYNYHPDAPADIYISDFSQLEDICLMESSS